MNRLKSGVSIFRPSICVLSLHCMAENTLCTYFLYIWLDPINSAPRVHFFKNTESGKRIDSWLVHTSALSKKQRIPLLVLSFFLSLFQRNKECIEWKHFHFFSTNKLIGGFYKVSNSWIHIWITGFTNVPYHEGRRKNASSIQPSISIFMLGGTGGLFFLCVLCSFFLFFFVSFQFISNFSS